MDDSHEKLLKLCRIRGVNVMYQSVSVKRDARQDSWFSKQEEVRSGKMLDSAAR
jgi:hypothetical protein